ncbi:MAG: hypothetical protein ACLTLQ_03430 [[Clostridium] scindens]
MLKESDIISIHVVLTPDDDVMFSTKGYVPADEEDGDDYQRIPWPG